MTVSQHDGSPKRGSRLFACALLMLVAGCVSNGPGSAGGGLAKIFENQIRQIQQENENTAFVPGTESRAVVEATEKNQRGTAFDGKIAIGGFVPLSDANTSTAAVIADGITDSELLRHMFEDDNSVERAAYIYRDSEGRLAKQVVKDKLIATGLLFAPRLATGGGFHVVPKPRYKLWIYAEDYYSEPYATKTGALGKLWHRMSSNTDAIYTDEMFQRGYYFIGAQYRFALRDEKTGKTIHSGREQIQLKVGLSKDKWGNPQESIPMGDEQILSTLAGRYLDKLLAAYGTPKS